MCSITSRLISPSTGLSRRKPSGARSTLGWECGKVNALGHGGGIDFRDMPEGECCEYLRYMDSLCRSANLEGWILHSWNGSMGFELAPSVVDAWCLVSNEDNQ